LHEHSAFSTAVTTFSWKTELPNAARNSALQGKSYVGEKFLQDNALTTSELVSIRIEIGRGVGLDDPQRSLPTPTIL